MRNDRLEEYLFDLLHSNRYINSNFPTASGAKLRIPLQGTEEISILGWRINTNRNEGGVADVALVSLNERNETRSSPTYALRRSNNFAPNKFLIKGETYYVGNGIILNSTYDVLLVITGELDNWTINKIVCRISPKVFENPKGIMEKYIINKIIPYCSTYIFPRYFPLDQNLNVEEIRGSRVKVIVDDLAEFIGMDKVTPPSKALLKEEDVYEFLRKNIRDYGL